jgi:3-hydroxybutyrate dehydrogenase
MNGEAALVGTHAIVTGGARGIGRAIAARLGAMGATLTLVGRDEAALAIAASALGGTTRCDWRACDVVDGEAVARTFAALAQVHEGIAILVNNAGAAKSAKFLATSPALWDEMLATNLTGVYHCTRAALPILQSAACGRIVNVASTAGLVGYPYVAAYCAAKHGVIGLTRALALEFAATRVTVNAVCPGYTDTDLVREAITNIVTKTGMTPEAARATLAGRNPQGRLVTPDQVAAAVAWLCLPESQAITGQAIAVAGGEVATG